MTDPSRPADRGEELRFAQLARPTVHSRRRLIVASLVLVGGILASAVLLIVILVVSGLGDLLLSDDPGAVGLALTLLTVPLITLPPAALTARGVLRMRLGEVCSVEGAFRWGWFWRCLAVAITVAVTTSAVSLWWGGSAAFRLADQWQALAVVVLLGVPLAAFAEEFVFRGVLTHILGARWSRPLTAVTVPAVTTSVLFGLVHGMAGIVMFLVTVAGGLLYAILCDQTGGLEAATAAHTAWNGVLMISVFLLSTSDAGQSTTAVAATLATDLLLVALLVLLARRTAVARLRQAVPVPAAG
ncbi:membrane protease YdiL (CAAX protease family) [Actinoalloteichus hoggarensis]|uniref:CAAX amino terminal protease self-immunity n=1 Tax=Actinoalloteichus hoggarensis TaxID=1470176 RepID=A0A221W4H8_9PSEU|nr:type II CAAX endopeptidase family protein [Actinoalloteichus hoggarensis]ASO20790.1 CAAX amino terminal protease self- immunity [Actinoalloteichus hoggarensis]MBB5920720.1 membrane protease YdiL (CAAX protease family) [Actinoalloteichus hoggarensis]